MKGGRDISYTNLISGWERAMDYFNRDYEGGGNKCLEKRLSMQCVFSL